MMIERIPYQMNLYCSGILQAYIRPLYGKWKYGKVYDETLEEVHVLDVTEKEARITKTERSGGGSRKVIFWTPAYGCAAGKAMA